MVAILEDLSSNGTFVNDALVGRNKRRELEDRDQVSMNQARFASMLVHKAPMASANSTEGSGSSARATLLPSTCVPSELQGSCMP